MRGPACVCFEIGESMADTVMRAIDRDVTPALLALAVIAPDDTYGAGTACRDSLRDLKSAVEAGVIGALATP